MPASDRALSAYWDSYYDELDRYQPPAELDSWVESYGISDESMVAEAFGSRVIRTNGPPQQFFFEVGVDQFVG